MHRMDVAPDRIRHIKRGKRELLKVMDQAEVQARVSSADRH